MVCRHISDELKEMALSMSLQSLRDSDIHEYTGTSEGRSSGSAAPIAGLGTRFSIDRGRPHILSAIQVKVRIQHLSPTSCCKDSSGSGPETARLCPLPDLRMATGSHGSSPCHGDHMSTTSAVCPRKGIYCHDVLWERRAGYCRAGSNPPPHSSFPQLATSLLRVVPYAMTLSQLRCGICWLRVCSCRCWAGAMCQLP